MATPPKRTTFTAFKGIKEQGQINNTNVVHLLKNFIFNADGSLRAFPEVEKLVSLPLPHSLYKINDNEYFVCSVQNGIDKLYLYLVSDNNLIYKRDLSLSYGRVYYASFMDKIFISNRYTKTIYDLKTGMFLDWVPQAIEYFDNVEEGSDYALTDVIEVPNLEYITVFGNRIVGAQGNKLIFTEAFFPTFTRATNYIEMAEPIIGIAGGDNRLLVLCPNQYYILYPDEELIFSVVNKKAPPILENSAVSYQGKFIFLTKEGIAFIQEDRNDYTLVNKMLLDIILSGSVEKIPLRDGEFLLGGKNFDFEFKDNIGVEIFRKSK